MPTSLDHCRIGSLENKISAKRRPDLDHCRIGSLEKRMRLIKGFMIDHCRIGSLEILLLFLIFGKHGSLPHRQLRN